MQHPSHHIFEHTPDSLTEALADVGMKRFRATQVLEWVYARGIVDPDEMTNLSKADRARLREVMTFESGDVVHNLVGSDQTRKMLVRWNEPGDASSTSSSALPVINQPVSVAPLETECVMIPTEARRTACISSQVGCPVGCTFCASGIGGLDGNLSSGRIVEQVWLLNRELASRGERISNVVFMGMGEPLANYQPVVDAVRILMAPWGLNLSGRRITISTVGLPAAIERLAQEDLPVTLAISLHAPNDEIRRELIPWADYTSIAELMRAGQAYFRHTGREITLEYILIRGVNDQRSHAQELATVAKSLRANVNLIRYNEVDGLPYQRPIREQVYEFQAILRRHGVNTHIRASRGRDIAAACGQLRHESRTNRADETTPSE